MLTKKPPPPDTTTVESWYVVTSPVESRYRMSSFGKSILIDPFGFEYFKSKTNDNTSYYVCTNYRLLRTEDKCRGKATVKDGQIIRTTPHNHMWDSAKTSAKLLEQDIFESINQDPSQTTQSLLVKWQEQYERVGAPVKKRAMDTMRRRIQKARAKAKGKFNNLGQKSAQIIKFIDRPFQFLLFYIPANFMKRFLSGQPRDGRCKCLYYDYMSNVVNSASCKNSVVVVLLRQSE